MRQEVEDYLAVFGLQYPRDVLAVVMLAPNFEFILGPNPKDMICRFEATQFYPKFVEAFKARVDPSIYVIRALDALRVWKEGGWTISDFFRKTKSPSAVCTTSRTRRI